MDDRIRVNFIKLKPEDGACPGILRRLGFAASDAPGQAAGPSGGGAGCTMSRLLPKCTFASGGGPAGDHTKETEVWFKEQASKYEAVEREKAEGDELFSDVFGGGSKKVKTAGVRRKR